MATFETSDGVEINYETWGDDSAPAVVLLHGFTASLRMWQNQVEALSQDYRVVAPDLRGHGRSGAPEDLARYSIQRYAEDIRELLDAIGAELCALVGCSFGGMIALQFATTWPQRLACLVVSDSSPAYDHPGYDEKFRERERGMRESEEVVRQYGTATLGKRLATNVADSFLAEGIRARYANLDATGYVGASMARRERPNLTPILHERITMPVMICNGEDDPVFCALDVMAAELPTARVVAFRGAGHGLPAVVPQLFTEVLVRFLRDVEDGAAIAGRVRV
ncbi:MAG: alpha/beta fold hydrolase [Dehalococcoidia bacterium]